MAFKNIHNEKELLSGVAAGDRIAFGQLYTHYLPLVQKYVSLFERVPETRDELTQDVFVRIWEKKEKLAAVDAFKGYLFLVSRNLVFNYIRSLRMRQRLSGPELSSEIAVGENAEAQLLLKQYYHIAAQGMEKLPDGRRKVLKMSIEQGLTLDEIADRLKISRSGVKKQLYAAQDFLRKYIREHGEMSLVLFVFLSLFEG